MGLPEGENREGMLNTNNWVERAFKKFHQEFLDCRANKRLDRLVIIAANEFLPSFRYWPPNHPTRNSALKKTIQAAHRLWATPGAVEEMSQDIWQVSEVEQWEDSDGRNSDPESDDGDDVEVTYHTVQRQEATGPLSCDCQAHTQSGRGCTHIWAVRLFLGNGDVQGYLGKQHRYTNLAGLLMLTRLKISKLFGRSPDRHPGDESVEKGQPSRRGDNPIDVSCMSLYHAINQSLPGDLNSPQRTHRFRKCTRPRSITNHSDYGRCTYLPLRFLISKLLHASLMLES